jgi:FkbM family methyltransferase
MAFLKRLIRNSKPFVEQFPPLARTYRVLRDATDGFRRLRCTPFGFKFSGSRSMEAGLFESDEVALIRRYLPQLDIAVNVGANTGYYCCIFLHSGIPVIAFEPLQRNLTRLYRNVAANGWASAIEVYPMALSDRSGLVPMYGTGTGASLIKGWAGVPEWFCRLVPSTTLDNVLGQRLAGKRALFLIDVEGSEKKVLEGAASQLGLRPMPMWIIEICATQCQPSGTKVNPVLLETFEVFWNSGYRAWTASRPHREITRQEVSRVMETEVDTLKSGNILFLGPGDPVPGAD